MQIRKRKTQKPRQQPVEYGNESHGKRRIVKDVMDAGFDLRVATKAVDVVFQMWKDALINHDRKIEFPLGTLKVHTIPKRLMKRKMTAWKIGNKRLGRRAEWTVYNYRYLIKWKIRPDEWERVLRSFNPGMPDDLAYMPNRFRKGDPEPPIRPFIPPQFVPPPSAARHIVDRFRGLRPPSKGNV